MRREWELEGLIGCWTLDEEEFRLLASKSGATRLGSGWRCRGTGCRRGTAPRRRTVKTGNNRAVSTATASSFLNNDAPLEGSGRGWSAPAEWVASADGLLPGLAASVPPGLPRIPGSFHPRRRGAGHLPGAAERAEVQVRLGQPPPALSATAGQHGRDCEYPGPAGPGQFSGVAGGAVRHRGDSGQAGGDVSGAWPVVAGAQVRIEIPSARAGASARARSRSACSSRHAARETRVRTRRSRRPAPIRSLVVTRPSCQPCSGNWTL